MSVDEQFSAFVAAYRAAGDADPWPYLSQVDGVDRAELTLRIDRFLETTPRRRFDSAAFARFRDDAGRQRIVDDVLAAANLAELRGATSRRTLARALATRLGLAEHEDAVRARYHDIESGTVDPARVKPSIWEALSESLGATVERVRAAADAGFAGAAGLGAASPVFTRMEQTVDASTPFFDAAGSEPPADDADRVVDDVFFD